MANVTTETPKDKAVRYYNEWKKWRLDLQQYWTQVDKNQEMYEFYKREDEETDSNVSLNTPFTIVEALVAKGNETNLVVDVKAKGRNTAQDFELWVSSVLKGSIEDPDIEAHCGTFRKVKEQYEREYYVKGNAFAEVNWLRKTDSSGKVIANGPYTKVLPYKSVIFNPAKQADSSDVYYVEKYVTWDELKGKEYDTKTKKGIYTNLYKLKRRISQDNDENRDHEEDQFISANKKITRKVPKIQLLERHEDIKITVIADGAVVIREADDPLKIGRCPILVSMNYKIAGRPYAYGEIDAIYKTVRAQDTVVNQNIQIINRYLRDSLLVDPQSDIDLDALMAVIEDGGVTYGNPKAVAPIPTNVPPQSAFMTIDGLQQAIERAARFSPYGAGLPGQESDQTKGTMGGIQSLQKASEPNFQVKLDDIQDSFMRPLARIYLKMIANLMGREDIRYGLLKDKNSQWVAATKGILLGKATLKDMLVAGMISEEEWQVAAQLMMQPTEEHPQGQDPNKEVIFDADWVVDVRLDNQSQIDKQAKTQQKMQWIQFSQQIGVQFSPEKTATMIGQESGIENPEELYMDEQEKMQQQQAMQGQMQQEQQGQEQQMQSQQQQQEMQMQNQQAMGQAKMEQEQQKMQLESQKGQQDLALKQAQAEQVMQNEAMKAQMMAKLKSMQGGQNERRSARKKRANN